MRYPLSVKSKSVETSGIPRDYKEALCEYVWNGFEANATTISITHTINVLGGIEEICISDNGSGICFETIQDTFGAFLASQKNALSLKIKARGDLRDFLLQIESSGIQFARKMVKMFNIQFPFTVKIKTNMKLQKKL